MNFNISFPTPSTNTPTPEQAAILAHEGHLIVKAGAGCGKTVTLIMKARDEVEKRRRVGTLKNHKFILILAFNTDIAKEISSRIRAERLERYVDVLTTNVCGKRALDDKIQKWYKPYNAKTYNLVKAYIKEYRLPQAFQAPLTALVKFAKANGLGIESTATYAEWETLTRRHSIECPDPTYNMSQLIGMAMQILEQSNAKVVAPKPIIDFDDMLYAPLYFNFPFRTYDLVMMDEAQDTNVIRKLICQASMHSTSSFIAVGDDGQAIAGYTGALTSGLDVLRSHFKAPELPLSTCFRCATQIISYAQRVHPFLKPAPNAPRGSVHQTPTFPAVSTIPPNSVILCRNNSPLISAALACIRANRPCYIEGREIGKQIIDRLERIDQDNLTTLRQTYQQETLAEILKLKAEQKNSEAYKLQDLQATTLTFFDHARKSGLTHANELYAFIRSLFSSTKDTAQVTSVVCLSTIHKSKGLEFDHVYLLYPDKFQPSFYSRLDWELAQERNLYYVAITRAKLSFTEILQDPKFNPKLDPELDPKLDLELRDLIPWVYPGLK